jgi:hypothetical protein
LVKIKTWKKILIGLALVGVVFASGIVVYIFTSGVAVGNYYYPEEKLTIKNAYVNGSTIFLDVQSFKGNIQFNGIIIENTTGYVINRTLISDSILEGQSQTISTDFTLTSGNYTATLTTAKGSSFVSPSFNVS